MHEIQLNEQLYEEVRRRANEAGFDNVDAYVAEVLRNEVEDAENLDHLFTPERLALIDRAAASLASGQGLTTEQVDAELAKRRNEWLRQKS